MRISRRSFLSGAAAVAAACSFPMLARAASTKTFRIGHVMPPGHPYDLGCKKFADLVAAGTNGAVKVLVYPSSQLGGELDILEGMKLGTIDGGVVAAGSVPPATGVNKFHLLDMPYIFKDWDAVNRFATGPMGEEFGHDLPERSGIYIVGWGISSFHNILNSVRPIQTPADLSNIKLRVWEAPGAQLALELMGAKPTPMAFSEAFAALQQRVVDGITNSLVTFESAKLYEVTKYLSISNHAFVWDPLVMSERALKSVGDAERKVMMDSGKEATVYWRTLGPTEDKKAEDKMLKAGIKANDVDRAAFVKKVSSGYDRYVKLVNEPGTEDLIAKLQAVGGLQAS